MDPNQGNIYSAKELAEMSEESRKELEKRLEPIPEADYLALKAERKKEVQRLFDRKGK